MIDIHRPERIVSILDPGSDFPETGPDYANRHLCLSFHDINFPMNDCVMPSSSHIEALLDFLDEWRRATRLLVHCRAGIGRSTATAYIAACASNPNIEEREIATVLRRVAPLARPNQTLIRLADRTMGRNGRMREAIAETGLQLPPIDVGEGVPFELPTRYHRSGKEP